MIVSELSNVVSPGITDNAVFYGGADLEGRFPPVTETDEFSFDVEIFDETTVLGLPGTDPTIIRTPVLVDSVQVDPATEGVSITRLSDSKFNISGMATNVFRDRFYKFRMKDDTIQILDPYEADGFYGVVHYKPDYNRFEVLTYTFKIQELDYERYMTVNNDWELSRLLLKQIVLDGK